MSIIKHKEQRVAVFIDTQNLYHSAKKLYNAKVNFKNVLEESLAGRKLIRAIAYVIKTEAGDEKDFFDALTKIGIETKTKDLQVFFDGNKKGDWDIGMAIDAIRIANKVDTVILATGDGDFEHLIEYLKNFTQVEVISFGRSTSSKLKEVCEDFIDMSLNPQKFIISHKKIKNLRKNKNKIL